jgi:hypothetical protein
VSRDHSPNIWWVTSGQRARVDSRLGFDEKPTIAASADIAGYEGRRHLSAVRWRGAAAGLSNVRLCLTFGGNEG